MAMLIVPFRGIEGKSRLELADSAARAVLARAMLADVVAACISVGTTFVVTPDAVAIVGATAIADPGTGQAGAVSVGLRAAGEAAEAAGVTAPFLVVNADLPCVTPRDLRTLARAVPPGGIALAAARDGTTNALALAAPGLFAPLYGPGSAARFAAHAPARRVNAQNLIDDVDTVDDLERLESRLGCHTCAALTALRAGAAA